MLYSGYRLAEPQLYYFQTDHLGTPLEVTDTNGNLAWVGHYRAWGKLDKARDGNGTVRPLPCPMANRLPGCVTAPVTCMPWRWTSRN
ncbi:hypothetical protein HCU01_43030 [Halomonas cupida]|uniref:RHS protein conserved region domain-containing protein n=1 Tax=Halomonas cupida TaxID=44933 RepID=A0ABQ0WKT2_9GAMM|nr:hypothetical protein HCU01_43030 [Halomonas cupida]